ncbi:hypothetical protein Dimus_007676, partial [Dionaea muscipula]
GEPPPGRATCRGVLTRGPDEGSRRGVLEGRAGEEPRKSRGRAGVGAWLLKGGVRLSHIDLGGWLG